MLARSLDIYVLAKLLLEKQKRAYLDIARDLGMSASEVHAAVRRLADAGVIDPETRKPSRTAVENLLFQGVRYVFPAKRGPLTRGIPTSYAAQPLKNLLLLTDDIVPVWPNAKGKIRGYSLEPLHPSAPKIAEKHPEFYAILALIDALREGRVREKQLAESELRRILTT